MFRKLFILLTLGLFFRISLEGQSVVAVHAVIVLTPPYSLSLSDYGSAGSDRMTINLWTSGFEATDVQLRLTIQGNGFKLVTRGNYMPPVINLQPGITEMLSGIDLSGYFDPSNLDFIGIDKQSYLRTNKLPEGYYTFTVDVYSYPRGNKVSGGSASAFIVLNDPPIINTPENNSKTRASDPQNIVFSWTPMHMGSPNSAFTTEYEIKIVEIWPKGRDPYEAMRTSPAIYENTVQSTRFVYDMMCPLLTPGNEYAFNIRAKAIKGVEQLDLFKNDGYSETFKFTFGDECKPPTGFEAQPVNGGGLEIKWKTGISHTGYNIRYRVKGSDKDWWTDQSMVDNIRVYQLPGNTDIEYEVDAECGTLVSPYSKTQYAHTAVTEQKPFVCINAMAPPSVTNIKDMPNLLQGAVINAGGFEGRITKVVRNADGSFNGECIVTIPYFNYAKVVHTFDHIRVNELGQLYQGKLVSKVDSTGKFMAKIDNNKKEEVPTYQTDLGAVAADSVIKIAGKIDSIYIKDNNLIIISDSGKQTDTIQQDQDKKTLVTDDKGNQYIASNGKVEKVGAEGPQNDIAQATTVNDIEKAAKNLPIIYFTPSGMQVFGYDSLQFTELEKSYLEDIIIDKTRHTPWKSIEAGGIDYLDVLVPDKNGNFNPASVEFKKETGTNIPITKSAKGKQLLLTGGVDETPEGINAYYLMKDTSGKQKDVLIGKVNVVTYEKLSVNLRIVPVNGDKTFTGNIQQELNTIYKQSVTEFNIQILDSLQVNEIKDIDYVEDEGTGVITTYSSSLKAIINAFTKKNQIDKEAYYIFLVPAMTKNGRAGYMLLNNQYGFIFTKYTTNVSASIAHEIGHGAFRLHHPFSDKNKYIVNTKPDYNLMAYNGGTILNKYQWDFIHHPQGGLYWFQSEEEAAGHSEPSGIEIDINKKLEELKNTVGETFAIIHCERCGINGIDKSKKLLYSHSIIDGAVLEGYKPIYIEGYYEQSSNVICNVIYCQVTDKEKNINATISKVSNLDLKIVKVPYLGIIVLPSKTITECTNNLGDWSKDLCSQDKNNTLDYYSHVLIAVLSCLNETKIYPEIAKGRIINYSSEKDIPDIEHLSKLLNGEDVRSDGATELRHSLKGTLIVTDTKTTAENYSKAENFVPTAGEAKIWIHKTDKSWELKSALPQGAKELESYTEGNGNKIYDFAKFTGGLALESIDFVATCYYEAYDALAKGVRFLRIPNYAWDDTDPDYSPKYAYVYKFVLLAFEPIKEIVIYAGSNILASSIENDAPDLSTALRKLGDGRMEFAFRCGIWNGAVETVASVPDILKIISGSLSSKGRDDFLKFYNSLKNFTLKNADGSIKCKGTWCAISTGFIKQFDTDLKIAEGSGEIVFVIALCFIDPAAIETAGGKVLASVVKVLKYFDELAGKLNPASYALSFTTDMAATLANKAGKTCARIVDGVLKAKAKKTTGEIIEISKKIDEITLESSTDGSKLLVKTSDNPEGMELVEEGAGEVLNTGNELAGAFINGWTKKSILAEVKKLKVQGKSLDPSTYLDANYIKIHLDKFKGKASYLLSGNDYDNYINGKSFVGRADGLYISNSKDIDEVLIKANGNISIIEQELGIPAGSWQGKDGIYRIDINNPENFNLRMSNGNETGANSLWEPGGYTAGGVPEAVTDPIPNNPTNINANKVIQ